MPSHSGYEALSQQAEDPALDASLDDIDETDDLLPPPVTSGPSSNRSSKGKKRKGVSRTGAPRSIDLGKLDTAFKRWTESISAKVQIKRKKKNESKEGERKEIVRSVFVREDGEEDILGAVPSGWIRTLDHKPPMTNSEWDGVVTSVRNAISEGLHPKMITKGSSGSYFARARVESKVNTVGVFKPKDEEPYGRLNPKTTKWLHRQLRFIIPFGRACLIPNLSYISEAAASLLDQRLQLHIVPRTGLVSLSSPAFFYDWIDRTAAKKGKPLPDKIGSLQYFMHGYTDASDFLRKHPWPGRAIADTFDDTPHRSGAWIKRMMSALSIVCGRTGEEDDSYTYDGEEEEDRMLFDASESSAPRGFYWSETLQNSFREELEKLVILDYLMRNTDRGADNYMIKCCDESHDDEPPVPGPSMAAPTPHPQMSELRRDAPAMLSSSRMNPATARPASERKPHIHIAAIDNSLSFPHEHPKGWRSYTYGWLFLPVSVIGRPFSDATRNHFLPLLTSTKWWEETTCELRKMFAVDPDFHPKMFARQLAVMKGQAYNIVQSLRHDDEGPLELTRRQKYLVWDDEVEVTPENIDVLASPASPHPRHARMPSSASLPPGAQTTRRRSMSIGDSGAPPLRRTSTDGARPRPVPFAKNFSRVHPSVTGVAALEQMEQIDKVEAKLARGPQSASGSGRKVDADEEVDVGEAITPRPIPGTPGFGAFPSPRYTSPPHSPKAGPSLPPVQELVRLEDAPEEETDDEVDLAALSKSVGHLDAMSSSLHSRWTSAGDGPIMSHPFDVLTPEIERQKGKTVVVERLEPVAANPLFSRFISF